MGGDNDDGNKLPEVDLPEMILNRGGGVRKLNALYSEIHPTNLLNLLQITLENHDVTPMVDEEHWTIKYTHLVKMVDEDNNNTDDHDSDGSEAKLNVTI
jgi:hypothetical protein